MKIAYDRDLSKVGTIVDVTDEEAARLVREGRAVHPDDDPDVAEPKTTPKKTGPKSAGA
jgi:hypothetical protein